MRTEEIMKKPRKVRKPRAIKYQDGKLVVDSSMAYYQYDINESKWHHWLGDDLKDLKRCYKWLGRAIAYLEQKKG